MSLANPNILRFDSLPSTNLEAMQRASDGAPEGLCIVAVEQTAGRGRLGRQWLSPRGAGIYFSIILRPQLEQNSWPLLTLMASLAVQETLREACGLQTDIKWPNDILHNEQKLCGILAETVETNAGRAVIVGIGINLTNESFPEELAATATSVSAVSKQSPDEAQAIETLYRCLMSRYAGLRHPDGAERLVREWEQHSSYANGKSVNVVAGENAFSGITRGLESDGALRVESDNGELSIVHAGDVTLRAR